MNILRSKIIVFVLMLLWTSVSQAATTLLENPPVKYFANKQGLELNQVQDLLLDAIDRASFPENVWTVEKLTPGEIIAKLVVRNKHIAYIKIQYDRHKIAVKYHDSQNLNYSRVGTSAEVIHPNYLKWVDFLMSKITYTTLRIGKTTLINESPQEVILKSSDKAYKVGVFAFGDKSRATIDKGITSSKRFTELLTGEMVTALKKIKTKTSVIHPVGWSRETEGFVFGDIHKAANSLCATTNSDVLIGGAMDDETGGQGYFRMVKFKAYNCETKETDIFEARIIHKTIDKFPYQIEFSDALIKLCERNRIFNNTKSGFKNTVANTDNQNQTVIVTAYGEHSDQSVQYGITSLAAMSKALTNEMKHYYESIVNPGTKITALAFGAETDQFLFGDKKSIGSKLCGKYSAKYIVAALLERSGGGGGGFRDLKIYGLDCKTLTLKQKQFRTIDAYDEKFAYQKQFTAGIKEFTIENKVFD